jgi:hypothetical protein
MIAVAVAALISMAPLQDPPPGPQGPPPHRPPPPHGEALRIFLDCDFCDDDFLRTEIRFVNYVRDRADAQLHVLVTRQQTGSGGWEYTFAFLGLRELAGRGDTLRTSTSGTATSDERRNAIARTLRLGLVRFVAATPLAERIEIRFTPPDSASAASGRPRDRWNYWVFRISANGNFSGEKRYGSRSLNGGIDIARTTPVSKIQIEFDANNYRNKSQYYEPDTTTADTTDAILRAYISRRERYSAEAMWVRAIGARWSAGAGADARQDSYTNIDLRVRLRAALEYSVFPYTESTRRLLLFRYIAGPEFSRYADTTVYLRTRETRVVHALEAEYSVTQPWGSASVESRFSQYLHDPGKYGLDNWGNLSVRLFRGFNVEVWGGYSVIHNQLYLRKEGETLADVIAQQRQLETSYSFYTGVGISYRFGSIFNNVVNPRFGN